MEDGWLNILNLNLLSVNKYLPRFFPMCLDEPLCQALPEYVHEQTQNSADKHSGYQRSQSY